MHHRRKSLNLWPLQCSTVHEGLALIKLEHELVSCKENGKGDRTRCDKCCVFITCKPLKYSSSFAVYLACQYRGLYHLALKFILFSIKVYGIYTNASFVDVPEEISRRDITVLIFVQQFRSVWSACLASILGSRGREEKGRKVFLIVVYLILYHRLWFPIQIVWARQVHFSVAMQAVTGAMMIYTRNQSHNQENINLAATINIFLSPDYRMYRNYQYEKVTVFLFNRSLQILYLIL